MPTYNERHSSIKNAMLSSKQSAAIGESFRSEFFELLPADYLFHSDVITHTVLFKNLRSLLESVGFNVERKSGLMIAQAIANKMYSDSDLESAHHAIAVSRQWQKSFIQSADDNKGSTITTAQPFNDSDRLVDATAKHFVHRAQYSGVLAESPSLAEMRNTYLTYCNDKNISQSNRVKLLHYALKGPAWTFWAEELRDDASITTIGAAFHKLTEKFDTPSHQKQVEHILESLDLDKTRKLLECGRVKALGYVYHEVDRLNPQISRNKRGDSFKSEQLMRVVEDRVWAPDARRRLLQDNITFSQIYSELTASALLWEERTRKRGLNPDTISDLVERRDITQNTASIFYGARCARSPPSSRNKGRGSPHFSRKYKRSRQNDKCFRCGKLGHHAIDCQDESRMSMTSAIRSRIKDMDGSPDSAAARILFEIATEYDDYENPEMSDEDRELAKNTFETLLNSSLPVQDEEKEGEENFQKPDSQ